MTEADWLVINRPIEPFTGGRVLFDELHFQKGHLPVTATATIFVKFQVQGFHSWPAAPKHRDYLASSHRHLFCVEVRCDVSHDDREVEFHDLLDFAKASFPAGDRGAASCEMMARQLGDVLSTRFNRSFEVTVSEDGEVGAIVRIAP